MNKKIKAIFLTLALVALAAFVAGCGDNEEHANMSDMSTDVTISDAWARVTTPEQKMGAAYMNITAAPGDKLVKVAVDPDVADHAEMHTVVMVSDGASADAEHGSDMGGSDDMSGGHMSDSDSMTKSDDMKSGDMKSSDMKSGDGKMTMKQVPNIPVPHSGTLQLKPGGFHIMLIGLKAPIAKGDKVELTLTFEKGGIKQVTAVAKD